MIKYIYNNSSKYLYQMSDEESKNDAEFKKKLNSLVGYFFGIIHDCRKEFYDREYTLRENERYKITCKFSKEITIDLEYEDRNTGKIEIKSKMKVNQKGLDYSALLSISIFGGISQQKDVEKLLILKWKKYKMVVLLLKYGQM